MSRLFSFKMRLLKVLPLISLLAGIVFSQEFYSNGFYKKITTEQTKERPDLYNIKTVLEGDDLRIDISEVKKSQTDKNNLASVPAGIRVMSGSFLIAFAGINIGIEKDKKIIDPFKTSFQNIYVAENNSERILIDAFWNLEESGVFSEKIIKYKTIPDWWIFLKIESSLPIKTLTFLGIDRGSWYNPYSPFNMVTFNGTDKYETKEFSKNPTKGQKGDFALCYYSTSNKTFMKFLVFSEKNIEFITFDKYGRLLVAPKSNAKEITIAIGFYNDRSDVSEERQQKIISEFFNNRVKEIKNRIESIEWTPEFARKNEVKNLFEEIEKYSKKEELKKLLNEYNFDNLKLELQVAFEKNDYRKIIDIEERLMQMKEKMYEILIESLK